ncbi:hypothetical protein Srufu_013690 [Streptomyces libani subsp. rufus]|nr:hypothetical protein Srufu_013690 [Streptomyces libani subsp. rufus]
MGGRGGEQQTLLVEGFFSGPMRWRRRGRGTGQGAGVCGVVRGEFVEVAAQGIGVCEDSG